MDTLLSLIFKENTISNMFTIVEIPTKNRKSTHEIVQSSPSNEEGICYHVQTVCC